MHASADTRLIRCLDGLAMSFSMLELVHANLHTSCTEIAKDKSKLVEAMWRGWSFIDTVHRLREVAQAVPGLSGKNPKLRAFLEATAIAEEFRHYIQHMRSEITKTPGNTFPVWGSLSWVDSEDPMLTHSALAGAQVGQTEYGGCIFDVVERKWVSKVALSVNRVSFNFDLILKACLEFREFVIPWLLAKYAPGITLREDLPLISIRLQFLPPSGA
jgi:hypothetical protein